MIGQFLLLEDHRLFALIILFYAPIIWLSFFQELGLFYILTNAK